MTGWRKVPADVFRAVFRARPSSAWSMREAIPRQGFTQQFTQHIHALGRRDAQTGM